MAESWKTASAGKVDVRIYPGGVAGDDPDMVRKMRIGQLQMAGLTGVGLSRIIPEIAALQMPMLLTNAGELNYVRERVSPEIEALLEEKGFKLLAWADVGWVHFFTRQPVRRPNDLKAEKLWIWAGDTTYLEAWKSAGYQPVPLPSTEIFTGLQSGLVTAFTTTPLAALSYQWFPKANHMTDLRWAPFVGALVITTRSWEEIPAALRPALLEFGEANRRARAGPCRHAEHRRSQIHGETRTGCRVCAGRGRRRVGAERQDRGVSESGRHLGPCGHVQQS